jgi:hypothetical protein
MINDSIPSTSENILYVRKIGLLIYFPLSGILLLLMLSFTLAIARLDFSNIFYSIIEFKLVSLFILACFIFLIWFQAPKTLTDLADEDIFILGISLMLVIRSNLMLLPVYFFIFIINTINRSLIGDFGLIMLPGHLLIGIPLLLFSFVITLLISVFTSGFIAAYIMRKHFAIKTHIQ